MKYQVRSGKLLNHNSRIYRPGEVVEDIADRVAADPVVAECIEAVVEVVAAVDLKKEKK